MIVLIQGPLRFWEIKYRTHANNGRVGCTGDPNLCKTTKYGNTNITINSVTVSKSYLVAQKLLAKLSGGVKFTRLDFKSIWGTVTGIGQNQYTKNSVLVYNAPFGVVSACALYQ